MKHLLVLLTLLSFNLIADVGIGDKAIDFKLMGQDGKEHSLSDFKGKTIVLEWYNEGCPFVKKYYNKGNMQALQKEFQDSVVWLTISSSAKDNQGYIADSSQAMKTYTKHKMNSKFLLLDAKGVVGGDYSAKTTPHMFVISADGRVVYNGAIDSIASANYDDIAKAKPLLKNAVTAVLQGKKVSRAKNKPYGCGVKY